MICKCGNRHFYKFKNTESICLICGEELITMSDYTVGLGEISQDKLEKARSIVDSLTTGKGEE